MSGFSFWTIQMTRTKILVTFLVLLAISGCKLKIIVPEGGYITTLSANHLCQSSEACVIEVNSTDFDETFVAIANAGYFFRKWEKSESSLCGGSVENCRLATRSFRGNKPLMAMLDSDATFKLKPIFMLGECEQATQEWVERDGDEQVNYRGQATGCPDKSGQIVPHGIVLLWANGVLVSESRWDMGRQHGWERAWWNNGKLSYELKWVDGVRHGPQKYYDLEGRLNHYADFRNGTWHGQIRNYNSDGILIMVQTLYENTLEGPERFYFDNGQLWISRNYHLGELHGLEEIYYEDGTLHQTRSYNNGVLKGPYAIYDGQGKLLEEGVH
jgi:antitoxin component YwqK of YwqJK toxin-antitoxin module